MRRQIGTSAGTEFRHRSCSNRTTLAESPPVDANEAWCKEESGLIPQRTSTGVWRHRRVLNQRLEQGGGWGGGMLNRSRSVSRRRRQRARQLAPQVATGDATPIILFLLLASATGGVDARSPSGSDARGAVGGLGEAVTRGVERVGGGALGGACLEHLRAARMCRLGDGRAARKSPGNAARGRQLSGSTRRRLGRAVGWGLPSEGGEGQRGRNGRRRLALRGGGDGVVLSDTLYVTGLPPFANEVLAPRVLAVGLNLPFQPP